MSIKKRIKDKLILNRRTRDEIKELDKASENLANICGLKVYPPVTKKDKGIERRTMILDSINEKLKA